MTPDQTVMDVNPREVLDHGFVRLVSFMQPASPDIVEYDRDMGQYMLNPQWTGDLEVVRNARVSHDADWRTGDDDGKDAKLLRFMQFNHHTSPFEAMVFTFEVKCPIFIARQWQRHRTWSYNEVSARYTALPSEFYVPLPITVGVQSKDNKQVRDLPTVTDQATLDANTKLMNEFAVQNAAAFLLYEKALAAGVPRELARSVLPVATYTRFFATVDLHNLLHFLRLRLHPHAQWEIREYAENLLALIEPVCPVIVANFKEELARGAV